MAETKAIYEEPAPTCCTSSSPDDAACKTCDDCCECFCVKFGEPYEAPHLKSDSESGDVLRFGHEDEKQIHDLTPKDPGF